MTLLDAREIFGYWEDHPPLEYLMPAVYGIKRKGAGPEAVGDISQLAAFHAASGGTGILPGLNKDG